MIRTLLFLALALLVACNDSTEPVDSDGLPAVDGGVDQVSDAPQPQADSMLPDANPGNPCPRTPGPANATRYVVGAHPNGGLGSGYSAIPGAIGVQP